MAEGDYDSLVMFAGVYSDLSKAEADYEAVKDLYYGSTIIATFDAAVIGKKDDGKVKIYRKHEEPTRHGGWTGAGWGIATGLAIALFPAAAIGTGLLATTTAVGAGVGAIAGHVADGMDRDDLKDLGESLDAGQAAVIVAAISDVQDKVAAVLTRADKVMTKYVQIDAGELAADVEEAKGSS